MDTVKSEMNPNKYSMLVALTSTVVACSFIGLWILHFNLPWASLKGLSVIAIGLSAAITVVANHHSTSTSILVGLLMGSAFGMMGIEILTLAQDPNWAPAIFSWLPAIL